MIRHNQIYVDLDGMLRDYLITCEMETDFLHKLDDSLMSEPELTVSVWSEIRDE